MSTNMAFKTRTRCYSFDQSFRKCDGSLVVNMIKNYIVFPDRVIPTAVLLLLLLCVNHHAHRDSKSRVYSGLPTRSYTAAAAGVAVRCCCCCGLGTRTHTRTVPLTSGWERRPSVKSNCILVSGLRSLLLWQDSKRLIIRKRIQRDAGDGRGIEYFRRSSQ